MAPQVVQWASASASASEADEDAHSGACRAAPAPPSGHSDAATTTNGWKFIVNDQNLSNTFFHLYIKVLKKITVIKTLVMKYGIYYKSMFFETLLINNKIYNDKIVKLFFHCFNHENSLFYS